MGSGHFVMRPYAAPLVGLVVAVLCCHVPFAANAQVAPAVPTVHVAPAGVYPDNVSCTTYQESIAEAGVSCADAVGVEVTLGIEKPEHRHLLLNVHSSVDPVGHLTLRSLTPRMQTLAALPS